MANVPLRPFFDSSGTRVHLGKKIGSGGEGDVYELLTGHLPRGRQDLPQAARREEKQEKLLLMARGCNDELKAISAWPTDVLSCNGGRAGRRVPDAEDHRL